MIKPSKPLKISTKTLTKTQQVVFNDIIHEINDIMQDAVFSPLERIISLNGPAGSGKSFLTARIIKYIIDNKMGVTKVTTTTHKSLEVIKNMLDDEGLNGVDSGTIHSHLRIKVRDDYNTGEQTFVVDKTKAPEKVDILFIDEYSMISEDLMKYIVAAVKNGTIKCVVFVGDIYQLPPVSGEIDLNSIIRNNYYLTEIARQREGSPIISLATVFRNQIETLGESLHVPTIKELLYNGINEINNNPQKYGERINDIKIYNREDEWMEKLYEKNEEDDADTILAAYTNTYVKVKNSEIRGVLLKDKIVVDEFNNRDFLIPGEHMIFQEAYTKNNEVIHRNNESIIVEKCEKKFNNGIWYWEVETTVNTKFKCIDPISMNNYKNMLNSIIEHAKSLQGIDRSKVWKRYFDIKNDFPYITYGYASTVHKTQGSTYKDVFFSLRNVVDFEQSVDFDMLLRLCYVAITRSSHNLYILV